MSRSSSAPGPLRAVLATAARTVAHASLLLLWGFLLSLPLMPARVSGKDDPPALPVKALDDVTAPEDGDASLVREVPIEDPGGKALAGFLGRLRTLKQTGQGRLRITHWGDSHLTPDVFSGKVRDLLQAELGAAGPGFVMPGDPWPSYHHRQVKDGADRRVWRSERSFGSYSRKRPRPRDDLLGVAGVSVYTRHPAEAWLQLDPRTNPRGASLSWAEVYYLRQPGGGELAVYSGDKELGRAMTAGTRKEPGYLKLDLPPGTTRLDLKAHSGEVRLYGVDLATGPSGVVYDALGLNGLRAKQRLEWNEALLAGQLARLGPDLVILAYGTNESDQRTLTREAYAASLAQVLKRLRRVSGKAACLLMGPPDRASWRRGEGLTTPENLAWIVEEQRRLALSSGCAFWDQRAAMGGPGSIFRWRAADAPLVGKDHVHLTVNAYRLLGEAFHRALTRGFEPGGE